MKRDTPLDNGEFGSSTGDARENDPSLPGFTAEDRLFRSHFQHANRLADQTYERVRPAYGLGYSAATNPRYADRDFDQAEKDLEGDWLNVRIGEDEWQSVRDYAREGFSQGRRIGFVSNAPSAGDSTTQRRPSYSDPVADNIDPTSPESPENRG